MTWKFFEFHFVGTEINLFIFIANDRHWVMWIRGIVSQASPGEYKAMIMPENHVMGDIFSASTNHDRANIDSVLTHTTTWVPLKP